MSWWEIERDPRDQQLDLLRDGRVMAFALDDNRAVAEALAQFKGTENDMIEDLATGTEYTVPEFLMENS